MSLLDLTGCISTLIYQFDWEPWSLPSLAWRLMIMRSLYYFNYHITYQKKKKINYHISMAIHVLFFVPIYCNSFDFYTVIVSKDSGYSFTIKMNKHPLHSVLYLCWNIRASVFFFLMVIEYVYGGLENPWPDAPPSSFYK